MAEASLSTSLTRTLQTEGNKVKIDHGEKDVLNLSEGDQENNESDARF